MDFFSILLIALGLSMDAFAVSVASGLAIKACRIRHALRIGLVFGGFQALMPVVGWLLGMNLRNIIRGVDHWIAFALLTLIGIKMIAEASKLEENRSCLDPLNLKVLLTLGVATSIDALAVGLTFAVLLSSVWMPVIVIGCVTFLLSFAGVWIGNRFGHFFEKKLEIFGGLILLVIGIRILLEHLIRGK